MHFTSLSDSNPFHLVHTPQPIDPIFHLYRCTKPSALKNESAATLKCNFAVMQSCEPLPLKLFFLSIWEASFFLVFSPSPLRARRMSSAKSPTGRSSWEPLINHGMSPLTIDLILSCLVNSCKYNETAISFYMLTSCVLERSLNQILDLAPN